MIFGSNATFLTITCVFFDLFRWDTIVSTYVNMDCLTSTLSQCIDSSAKIQVFQGHYPNFKYLFQTLFLLSAAVHIASIQFMTYMAKPKITDTNQILDSGVDLNMEGGIAE